MKRKKLAFLTLIVVQILRGTVMLGQNSATAMMPSEMPNNTLGKQGWQLIWHDEFDGGAWVVPAA